MALIRTGGSNNAYSTLTTVTEQAQNAPVADISLDAGIYTWYGYYNGSTAVGGNYEPVVSTGNANYVEFAAHDEANVNSHFSCGVLFVDSSCVVRKSGQPYGCKVFKLT